MAEVVKARPRAIAGPETLSNGGKKWSVVLDNGSMLCTFSEGCQQAVSKLIDDELTFEVEVPDNPNMSPKILKVIDINGTVAWEPSAGRGPMGGRPFDVAADIAKHSVGCASANVSAVIGRMEPGVSADTIKALIAQAMTEWAPLYFDTIKDLRSQGVGN